MKSEFSSTPYPVRSMNRSSTSVQSRGETSDTAQQLSQEFAGELDAESIEASLSRARTLMFDDVPIEELIDRTESQIKLNYVQGVMHGQQAYLITNLLKDESQTLVQSQQVWTIGRNREAAFPLQDPMLSRRHAVILHVKNEGFYLVDLNSMNGTFVNGTKVQHRHLLKDGDRISLGNVVFTFLVSSRVRSLAPIHPEVVSRLNATESRPLDFIDYLASDEALFG
jgi:hypothetical protein